LLTYAAGLNAVTVVWIADRFTDEHRAVLDWLNEITDDRFNFFGIEIELWRIGESPVAPHFKIVSKPNDWTKSVSKGAAGVQSENLTEAKKLQLEYWTAFRDYVLKHSSVIKSQKPLPQHWTNFAIGRSHFHMSAIVNTWEKKIGVVLYLGGSNAKPHYHLLHVDKSKIEEEIGCELEWRENPDKKDSGIWLRYDYDPSDKDMWIQQHSWLLEKLEAFRAAFAPRVKSLDASEYGQLE